MKKLVCFSLVAALWAATPALADLQKVQSQSDFMALVNGKTLTRPLVKLEVSPTGSITGTGAVWDVKGQWTWENGYFCRSLFWGGDDLGYNCQEVASDGGKIRFTSDQGAGQSADFTLR